MNITILLVTAFF